MQDPRLDTLAQYFQSKKVTPAGVRFVDIAGLVKGASQGEGLGNQFLSHIREVDAIAHVVRCFTDANVVDVTGGLAPVQSLEIIATELLLADLEQAQRVREKWLGAARSGDEKARKIVEGLEAAIEGLNQGIPARRQTMPPSLQHAYQFLTGKPLLVVANVGERDVLTNPLVQQLSGYAAQQGIEVVVLSAKIESEIAQLSPEERSEFLASLGFQESGLARLVHAGQRLLRLMTFFTAGPEESRAWNIPEKTAAVKAAGKIHSDIERGFIRAEIYTVSDLIQHGSEANLKAKGLIRIEGRDYLMQDGDVAYFRFNV